MKQLSVGIDELRGCVARMSGLVEAAVQNSFEALARGDERLALEVFEGETLINGLEMEIDSRAIRLLALHQPVACDLRFITASMKINTDLERIGDLAANTARRSSEINRSGPLTAGITEMSRVVKSMVYGAIDAFLRRNDSLAMSIIEQDDEADSYLRSITRELVTAMQDSAESAENAVQWLVIARNLERMADHSTNIAEAALFLSSGADIRHRGAAPGKHYLPPEIAGPEFHAA